MSERRKVDAGMRRHRLLLCKICRRIQGIQLKFIRNQVYCIQYTCNKLHRLFTSSTGFLDVSGPSLSELMATSELISDETVARADALIAPLMAFTGIQDNTGVLE